MSNNVTPDQGLKLAEDGRLHTAQCVSEGWSLLDWDVDCVRVGVPSGGKAAALGERALFVTSLAVLPIVTTGLAVVERVRRDR